MNFAINIDFADNVLCMTREYMVVSLLTLKVMTRLEQKNGKYILVEVKENEYTRNY